MKFPKSMHAEGWASHLEETKPEHLPDALKPTGQSRPAVGPARFKPTGAGAKISIHEPLHATAAEAPRARPAAEPVFARTPTSTPAAAAVRRDGQMSWMIPAGAGAAIIAAVAIWAMNRPSEAPVTPPALVVGSAEPQAEVAAVTPAPEATAASQVEDSTTTVAAAPEPAPVEPARLGPPVTTTRPAVEPRPVVAQAPTPAARPDMVSRAAPTSPVAALTPPATVAAAPTDSQPLSVPPGSAPIVMPPTAAGPTSVAPVVTPPAAIPPVAAATPDATAASSVATGSPPLAQAQPLTAQPQQPAQPAPEDSGITAKVRMALAADPTLSAVPIAVSTDHGVVKLEGQAPDAQTRERATFVVAGTSGVKAIDNRLTLPPGTVVGQLSTPQ